MPPSTTLRTGIIQPMTRSSEPYDADAGTLFSEVDAHRTTFNARRQAYMDAAEIKGKTVEESWNRNFAGSLLIVRSPKGDRRVPLGHFASGNPMIESGSGSHRAYDTGVFSGEDNVDCAERKLLEYSGQNYLRDDPHNQKTSVILKGESEIRLSYRSLVDELTSVIVLVSDNTPCSVCERRLEIFIKNLLNFCSSVEVHVYATALYHPAHGKQQLASTWTNQYNRILLDGKTKLFRKFTTLHENIISLQREIQDNRNIRIENTKSILSELDHAVSLIEKNMDTYDSKIETMKKEIVEIEKNLNLMKQKLSESTEKIKTVRENFLNYQNQSAKTKDKSLRRISSEVNDAYWRATEPERRSLELFDEMGRINNIIASTRDYFIEAKRNIESVKNYIAAIQGKISKGDVIYYYNNMQDFQSDVQTFKENLKIAWTHHKSVIDKINENLLYLKNSLGRYRSFLFENNPEGLSSEVDYAIRIVNKIEGEFNDFHQKKESEKHAIKLDAISKKTAHVTSSDKNKKTLYSQKMKNIGFIVAAIFVLIVAFLCNSRTQNKTL